MIKIANPADSTKSFNWYMSIFTMTLAITLVGCNSDSESNNTVQSSNESEQETQVQDPEPTEAELEAEADAEAEAEGGIAIGDNEYEEVTFVEAIDANNVVVESENGQETIRLAGMEAPTEGDHEWVTGAKGWAEPYQAVGETVKLVRANPSENEEGESLGYIWYVGEGLETQNINYGFVSGGLARVPSDFEDERYKDRLVEAEEHIKNAEIYIWSLEGFVTESGFDYDVLEESQKEWEEENSNN